MLICARWHAQERGRMHTWSHNRCRRGADIGGVFFRGYLRGIRRHGPVNVISTSNHVAPGIHVHVMSWMHSGMFHPVASSSRTLRPMLRLVLVGELYFNGFVDSIKLQLAIKSIDGTLGHLTLPKLDKGASILRRIIVLLPNNIYVRNVSVRRENLADEAFICIPWQLTNK